MFIEKSEKNQQVCENDYKKMVSPQHEIARVVIVLGMAAAVATIVYLTPIPDHTFVSCDRPCHALDYPMICRIKLYLEHPKHNSCDSITTNCSTITQQGSPIRYTPGPPIHVCHNDLIVVDLVNKLPGHSLALHWRGQRNLETPFMDGVPLITQCPITSYATFQYRFRASASGTHFYHSYSDKERAEGLFGALVVRQPDATNPHRKLYDFDDKNHTILINEANMKTILINGGNGTLFRVLPGKRYRFRVAYTSGACPVTLDLGGRAFRVIALDGREIKPLEVNAMTMVKGERLDFVLKTGMGVRYVLRVRSKCGGEGEAVVSDGSDEVINDTSVENQREFSTGFCRSEKKTVCLDGVKSVEKVPERLAKEEVDKVLYLTVGARDESNEFYAINNLTFTYPSSPLLTQLSATPLSIVCDEINVPDICHNKNVCECVHVEYIPLESSAEIVLINQDAKEHIFHLHGYRVWLMGAAEAPKKGSAMALDAQGKLLARNYKSPVLKDTFRLAGKSVLAVRFIADNPGFWMLRDENSGGWTRGMDMVFQVGDSIDMMSTPSYFPTCGNFIGPNFILT